jgi:hypothetical protein
MLHAGETAVNRSYRRSTSAYSDVRFLGVDLAWGARNPSGLAVLDEGGRVVAEDLATSAADIAAFVSAHDQGGAVLALRAMELVEGLPRAYQTAPWWPATTTPARSSCRSHRGLWMTPAIDRGDRLS